MSRQRKIRLQFAIKDYNVWLIHKNIYAHGETNGIYVFVVLARNYRSILQNIVQLLYFWPSVKKESQSIFWGESFSRAMFVQLSWTVWFWGKTLSCIMKLVENESVNFHSSRILKNARFLIMHLCCIAAVPRKSSVCRGKRALTARRFLYISQRV